MCGVIAAVSFKNDLKNAIYEGLCALEYRGYDSFGIGYKIDGQVKLIKKVGAPSEYIWKEEKEVLFAIGHTRWATHGGIHSRNAHPHSWIVYDHTWMMVHNGVVENFDDLKNMLRDEFLSQLQSETDTEVILALFAQLLTDSPEMRPADALKYVAQLIQGSYAILLADFNRSIIFSIKRGLPLALSVTKDSVFIVSDLIALPENHIDAILLADDQIFQMEQSAQLFDQLIWTFREQPKMRVPAHGGVVRDGSFQIEKEIIEQITLIPALIYRNPVDIHLDHYDEVHCIGCGSSYYASFFIQELKREGVQIPVFAYIASHFVDNPPLVTRKTLLIAVSQSGETADVIAALKAHREAYQSTIAITNKVGSMIEHYVDETVYLNAGPEYSVASTKAFTAQLVMLSQLLGYHGIYYQSVTHLSQLLYSMIYDRLWDDYAIALSKFSSILILARGCLLPIAYEGALKMRELSYKNVYAFPSGELKHGTLAIVDTTTLVIICSQTDSTQLKQVVAAQEVRARGASVWIVGQESSQIFQEESQMTPFLIPRGNQLETAIFFTLFFQMLAYRLAVQLGHHPDRPRNLAKSVTVE